MEFLFHEATDVHIMFPHCYVKWMGNRPGKLQSVRENPPIVQNVVFGHQCASRIGERVPVLICMSVKNIAILFRTY